MDDAERCFREACKLNERFFSSRVNLSLVLLQRGSTEEGIKWIEKALELSPSSAWAHAIRGQAYVTRHSEVENEVSPELRKGMLESAKESLMIARPAYPIDSQRGMAIQAAWDYVVLRIEY